MNLRRTAAIALAFLAVAAGALVIAFREPHWPGRLWTLRAKPSGEPMQTDDAATAPGAEAEYVLAWWNDIDRCDVTRRESALGRLFRALGLGEVPCAAYGASPLVLIDRERAGWVELVRLDGEVPTRPEDPEGLRGGWEHTRADGTVAALRLLDDGTVEGGEAPTRWAAVDGVLVVSPTCLIPTGRRKVAALERSPHWPHRFQATLSDDRRSYVGADGRGLAVHGRRVDATGVR